MPGMLTPRLQEGLVRLGTWLPFAPAARMLAHFTGVRVSAATARRQTERTGAAWVQLQEAEVARLEQESPDPVPGPAVQQLSVDGAMVPLVGGTWGEVKLLAIGSVSPAAGEARTVALSYFGRRADHATFARLALVETHRRGTATAGVVVGHHRWRVVVPGVSRLPPAGCGAHPRLRSCHQLPPSRGDGGLRRGKCRGPELAGDADA